MGAEERWAQKVEWAEEKRRGLDVEIKSKSNGGDVCFAHKCNADAVVTYEVGPVEERWSRGIELCAEHDDEEMAFQVYREMGSED